MHAVGDVADRNFFFDAPRPQVGPHAPRNVAVQRAHGVGPPRKLEADHGHAERFAARSAARRGPGPSAARS